MVLAGLQIKIFNFNHCYVQKMNGILKYCMIKKLENQFKLYKKVITGKLIGEVKKE